LLVHTEDLKEIIEEVVKLGKSPANLELKDAWERFYAFEQPDKVPVKVWMNDSGWAKYLGYDLVEVFEDPEKYLLFRLQCILHQKKLFPDDTPAKTSIGVGFGPTLVPSLFGVKPVFRPDTIPWPGDGTPLIRSEKDLDEMDCPDFHHSGLMPRVHHFYEALQELAGPGLEVVFPGLTGHPWALAENMRGMTNLLMDMYLNPPLVHKLMNYIVESIERLAKERERFLGIERTDLGGIGADAVDCNKISPEFYLEFIHPYEQKMAKIFKPRVAGYHSCGNLTPILDYISDIPGMQRLHCSPWTDFKKSVDICKAKGMILEKRMHAVDEIMLPTQEEMENTVKRYLVDARGVVMHLSASLDGDVAPDKLLVWLGAARKAIESE